MHSSNHQKYIFFSNFKGINGYDRNVLQTEQNYKQIFAWESELVNYCHKIKSHDYISAVKDSKEKINERWFEP